MEENSEETKYNTRIHEMCRACMSLKSNSTYYYSLYVEDIKKMFTECTSIQIQDDCGFPQQICTSCHEQLILWNNFRNQCVDADIKLHQIVLPEFHVNKISDCSNAEICFKKYEDQKHELESIIDNKEIFLVTDTSNCFEENYIEQDSDGDFPLSVLVKPSKRFLKKARLLRKSQKKLRLSSFKADTKNILKKLSKRQRSNGIREKKKVAFNVLPGEQVEMNNDGEAVKIKCRFCNRRFYLSENLKEHMKVHEGKTIPECDICNRKFKSIESLRCHKLSHADVKKHTCKICGKSFLFNYVLTHHMGTHSGEKTIPCEQCGKTFRTKALLETHMQVHSDETPYSCEICSKKFKRNYGLKVHLIRCKGEKNFTCVECGKSFAVNADLKIHLRSHTGEKPFACDFCEKKFRTHSHMTLHRRNHTGERPHACSSCPMKFMTKKSLAVHYLIHTGELPHACSICNRLFRQKSALRTHMKTHNIASSEIISVA